MSELKPCPFCEQPGQGLGGPWPTETVCVSCQFGVKQELWDSRPIEDALREENKRLRELVVLAHISCEQLHHEKGDYHDGPPCPVELRYADLFARPR